MSQSASLPMSPDDMSPISATGPVMNIKTRKRTRTGCLTCRKRRIKCGEERPTCANCIKSKRQCEGYNQRVIFRPPIGDWPNHSGAISTIQYHSSTMPGTRNEPYQCFQSDPQSPDGPHASIQPQPFDFASLGAHSGVVTSSVDQVLGGAGHAFSHETHSYQTLQSPLHRQPLPTSHNPSHVSSVATAYFSRPSPVHASSTAQFDHDQTAGYRRALPYAQNSAYSSVSDTYENHVETKPTQASPTPHQSLYHQSYQSSAQPEAKGDYHSQSMSPQSQQYPTYSQSRPALQRSDSQSQASAHSLGADLADLGQQPSYHLSETISHADFGHTSCPPVQIPFHEIPSNVKYMSQPVLGMSRV